MLLNICAISIPSIFQLVFSLFVQLINLSFGGYLGDPNIPAAIGMGNMYANLFFASISLGLNSTIGTFVS